MANEFDDLTTETRRKVAQRGERRAAAVNAVDLARRHRDTDVGLFSQAEADTIMYITELLDKIATVQ